MISFLVVFLIWHFFYLFLKNFINVLTLFDRRFSKGWILSIVGVLIILVFLLKPILVLFGKVIQWVFLIVNSVTEGYSSDGRAKNIAFAIILNVVVFILLHFAAKRSRNIYFKWFYELGFPTRKTTR